MENILLTKSGLVKVADFGLSRELSNSQSRAKTFLGTMFYIAPELWRELTYTFSADIWCLGVLLYKLCTFKFPFYDSNGVVPSLSKQIIYEEYEPISN